MALATDQARPRWLPRPWLLAFCVNFAVVVLILAAAERYFQAQEPLERRMDYSEEVFSSDEALGYKASANRRIGHRSYGGEQLLYDVTYTLDAQGLRISAPIQADRGQHLPCLAFFGDSFTFGEGAVDEDTLPYQVWKRIGHRYRTVNFGFLGYGPHQMLAAIEQGHLTSRGHCQLRYIIYQAIPAHVSRAAGLEFWDYHGPRYRLEADGTVRHDGHFDDRPPATPGEWLRSFHRKLPMRMREHLESSALYRRVFHAHRPVYEPDIALYASIVATAQQTATQAFPDAAFRVLFWDYDDDAEVGGQVLAQLRARGIAVYPMSEILPGFPAERARYEISPYDKHPNALAHRLIADFVVGRLIEAPPEYRPSRPQEASASHRIESAYR